MRYKAREAGFIGRRIRKDEEFDYDGDVPWADIIETPEPPKPSPAVKQGKRRGQAADDEPADVI